MHAVTSFLPGDESATTLIDCFVFWKGIRSLLLIHKIRESVQLKYDQTATNKDSL